MSHDLKSIKTTTNNRELSVKFEEVEDDGPPPPPKPILKRRPTCGDLLIKSSLKFKQAPEKPPRSTSGQEESASDIEEEFDLKRRRSSDVTGKCLHISHTCV